MSARAPVTALYVPGSRPDRFDKAATSGADVVILDLEDAVAPADKPAARADVVAWLAAGGPPAAALVAVQVRINALTTPWGADDLAALPQGVDVRVPKVQTAADLEASGSRDLHAIIESAAGVEGAYDLARHPRVRSLALGEADLAADLGVSDESALSWVRMRLVVAARAAGLPAPMMSVFATIGDLDGLAASCAAGRALGMRGRTAIHPSQLPVIRRAFAPSRAELAWSDEVLSALETAGGGVAVLRNGAMVDAAMARRARDLLDRSGS
ncbi:MAG: HpcH/HpaI aldolase/citrate lyase family protein [Nocardioidaceae bacterium]